MHCVLLLVCFTPHSKERLFVVVPPSGGQSGTGKMGWLAYNGRMGCPQSLGTSKSSLSRMGPISWVPGLRKLGGLLWWRHNSCARGACTWDLGQLLLLEHGAPALAELDTSHAYIVTGEQIPDRTRRRRRRRRQREKKDKGPENSQGLLDRLSMGQQ